MSTKPILSILKHPEPSFTLQGNLSEKAKRNLELLIAKEKNLNPRPREVFQFLSKPFTNKKIAGEMNISVKTVEKHRRTLLRELGRPGTLAPVAALLTGNLDLNGFLEGLNFSRQNKDQNYLTA